MPFTPFHFGLGYAAAGIVRSPKYFSFYVFVVTQVVIDTETLLNILSESNQYHTFFHTILGSLVAAVISIFVCALLYLAIKWFLLKFFRRFLEWLTDWQLFPASMPSIACLLVSSVFGALSHVFLDGIMHGDVFPFAPFSKQNPLIDLVSVDILHISCVGSFFLGAVLLRGIKLGN